MHARKSTKFGHFRPNFLGTSRESVKFLVGAQKSMAFSHYWVILIYLPKLSFGNGCTVLLTSTKYVFFKFLEKNKKIGDYVDLANDQALVKYHYFWSCQS